MIRLIASDVDRTLVEEGTRIINPEYFDVIRALRGKGILFVAASGRNVMSLRALFAPVQPQIGMISDSGAVWWKDGGAHVIRAVPYEVLLEMEDDVRRIPGAGLIAETAEKVYMHPGNPELYHFLSDGYGNEVTLTDGHFPAGEAYVKLAVYHPDRIEEASAGIFAKWQDRLHLCFAGGVWLDIIMPGCNKGNALACIQQDLGITPGETAAFGDNGNDIEMLQRAGISYAVAGAREEVKEAASHVIGPWQEDSVLQELKRILAES